MKFSELKDLSLLDLKKKRSLLAQDLFEAKMKNSVGQLANTSVIKDMRRNIAKINTAIVRKTIR